ncbi:hypothetical protein BOX15_Mlig005477g1 [Macrostomum lignano]|uniref:Uncharacterized protein n=1 Tax=Macrostomum lignano TaxID=282301 RepID=A0A267G8X9_9PLAT|nr:hypothetical protein BOX15_Mlig005477g1 [Macrostomum lignano]
MFFEHSTMLASSSTSLSNADCPAAPSCQSSTSGGSDRCLSRNNNNNNEDLSAEERLVLAQLDSAMLTARRHSQQQSQNSECNHPDEEVDVDSTLIVELDARTRHQLEEAGHRRLRRSRSVTRSLLTLFLSQVSVAADGTEGPASVHPVTPDEGSEQSGAAESFRVVQYDCQEFNF